MTKRIGAWLVIVFFAVAAGYAQEPQGSSKTTQPGAAIPVFDIVRVQIVLAKYQGEKKTASASYEMTVPANGDHKMLRLGSQIPVSTPSSPTTVQFKDVGVAIDCAARSLDDGRYQLNLTVSDSSIYADDQRPGSTTTGVPPIIRSFQTSSTLVVRPAVASQFGVATDKVTGEVIKGEVTLTVVR